MTFRADGEEQGQNFEISSGRPHQAFNETTVGTIMPSDAKSSVRGNPPRRLPKRRQVQPAIVQIMLTTADSAQLWPGRNTYGWALRI